MFLDYVWAVYCLPVIYQVASFFIFICAALALILTLNVELYFIAFAKSFLVICNTLVPTTMGSIGQHYHTSDVLLTHICETQKPKKI